MTTEEIEQRYRDMMSDITKEIIRESCDSKDLAEIHRLIDIAFQNGRECQELIMLKRGDIKPKKLRRVRTFRRKRYYARDMKSDKVYNDTEKDFS